MSEPLRTDHERLKEYLEILHPMVKELRRQGWPAEASVETVGGKMVVWLRCDMRDLRVPEEAVEGHSDALDDQQFGPP